MECTHCGTNILPRLEISGPHIKAICNFCQEYIKFISRGDLPTLEQVKILIYKEAHEDLRLISACKVLSRFAATEDKDQMYIQYWNLLLKVQEIVTSL